MKTWFSKIFGKDQQPPQADAEQTIPADIGRTVLASASIDPQAVHAAEAQVAAEWKVGDVILDLYEVKHVFEGGGMGLVYRVHHRGWNTDLAVKSPRRDYFKTETQKENFTRECETWINLGLHPHIVSCHYVRTLGGIPRVFAEYVEGGTLKEWIDSRKLYEGGEQESLKRILDVAIQMAWGLHYAHEQGQGLVHQDVKPANVLMMPDGTAKITDFGLAKARAASGDPVEAGAGRSVLVSSGGMTPAYCSPEQANKQALSRKTDIWSWAVSVLEMFSGEVCWQSGVAAPEVLKRLSEVRTEGVGIPKMPEGLRELLQVCFELYPTKRPKDTNEIARRLVAIYHDHLKEDYDRPEPVAAELRADALNNRGVSMLDLGKGEEAEKLWAEALKTEPQHLDTTYNLGLFMWRTGRIKDIELLSDLRESEKTADDVVQVAVLRARVLLESDDCAGAVSSLEALEEATLKRQDVFRVLEAARQRLLNSRRCLRIFVGITAPAFLSADGRFVLSASKEDAKLCLWDVNTGERLRTFAEQHADIESINLSHDGRFALSLSSGDWTRSLAPKFKVWEVSTGRCLRTFNESRMYSVTSARLSGDGRFLLTGGLELKLWDVATGECLRVFEGHTDRLDSISVNVDGRFALSGSDDKTLRLWEVATGRCLNTIQNSEPVRSVTLSADGRLALTGGKSLKLWDMATGKCLRNLISRHNESFSSLCLSADGRFALTGGSALSLWNLATGKCLRTLEETQSSVTLSADGRLALSCGKTTKLWEVMGDAVTQLAPEKLSQLVTSYDAISASLSYQQHLQVGRDALSRGEPVVALRAFCEARNQSGFQRDRKVLNEYSRLYPFLRHCGLFGGWETGTIVVDEYQVHLACLLPDGRSALSVGVWGGGLKLWDLASGKCLRTLEGHSGPVSSMSLSADGRFVVSGGSDKKINVSEVATGKCLRTFLCGDSVGSVCVSADGCFVLSSCDKTLKLWEVATGRGLRTFEGHTNRVNSACLSEDGRFALSGSNDYMLRLWDVATGHTVKVLWDVATGHTDKVRSVCLSSDGRFALSGSSDKTLKLWELATGKCLRTFEGHSGSVDSVCLSADGRFALSGSADAMIKLWEVATGCCEQTFVGHTRGMYEYGVTSVCLSLDARTLLSSGDKTLKMWFLDWELEENQPTDWSEDARPYLSTFLSAHTPYTGLLPTDCQPSEDEISRALIRRGRPTWNEEDFQSLLFSMGCAGLGWLRPEGVRRQLEKMTAEWQRPPPIPWEQTAK